MTKISVKQSSAVPHTIVVGSGPVGVRFAHELLQRQPNSNITMFAEESVLPYNRVMLSSLLAGQSTVEDLELDLPIRSDNFRLIPQKIIEINTSVERVIDNSGNSYNYDQLILATGAHPHIPNIPGTQLPGVYTFRNLMDAQSLYARSVVAKHIVVGGGLLGIETACSLRKKNRHVIMVQQGGVLMNRQLAQCLNHFVC